MAYPNVRTIYILQRQRNIKFLASFGPRIFKVGCILYSQNQIVKYKQN